MDALHKIGRACLCIVLILVSGACGKSSDTDQIPEAQTEFFGMDTYIKFTAYGDGAEDALKEAEEKMADLEEKWSATEEDSEIYRISHSKGEAVLVSEETAELLAYALNMAAETEGALEPTIYPVVRAWGFTAEENRIPEPEEIEELLTLVDYEKVILSGGEVQLPEGMELDLGAVGKGYAGDVVTELLKESGISSALLDLGGNIQAVGSRLDGSDWRLGIRNPFGEGSVGVLSVSDRAVVTSGNYERFFAGDDGKEYGHIINPETGYPVDNTLASVTIIAEEGKLADALSTAMLVKGLDGALEYWKEHPGFEMIAVTKDGEIYLTQGVSDRFSLSGSFANMEIKEVAGTSLHSLK